MTTETLTPTARRTTPRPAPEPPRRRLPAGRTIAWIVMVLIILVTLFPFYWMLRTALSTNTALASDPSSLLPVDLSLGGFARVFGLQSTEEALAQGGSGASVDFWRYLLNSVIVATTIAVCQTFFSAMAAYGIVRLRIPQGMFWFLLIYSGTIFPFQMYLIPLFNFYLDTGLYDTRLGVIAFYVAITIPFCVFVMRGFFLTVPWQVQEAAALDGANSWATFWRIMMPMAKAPLILLVLIQFTWIWNDLLFGLVLTKSESVRPIMVALAGMQGVYGASDGPSVIAATLVGSAPTLILFLVLQRYFVRGLTLGMGER